MLRWPDLHTSTGPPTPHVPATAVIRAQRSATTPTTVGLSQTRMTLPRGSTRTPPERTWSSVRSTGMRAARMASKEHAVAVRDA
jgi:hypothetical protein